MSNFKCEIIRITEIRLIPGADSIELAIVGPADVGYRCVIAKGLFRAGQLACYLPEGAIVPQPLLAEMGLEGKLHGAHHDRIKIIRLRGQVSQGLL